MKLITIIMSLLAIGFVLVVVGLFVSDMEQYYPEANINDSSWAGKYNYQEEINASVSDIQSEFEEMGNAENWWTVLGVGFVAFAKAIFLIPQTIFLGITKGTFVVSGIGEFAGAGALVVYGITALIVVVVFSFITWWRKFKE